MFTANPESDGKTEPSVQSFLNEENGCDLFVMPKFRARMIAPDGSYPVLSRSVSYRSAAFQVLGACALFREKLPESGEARTKYVEPRQPCLASF
ncbi:MAG: DUF2264 domain-containing protein [Bacteroides cellulosilyticus]